MDSSDTEAHYFENNINVIIVIFLLFKINSGKVHGGNSTSFPLFLPRILLFTFFRNPVSNNMHSDVFMRVQQHKLTLLPWISGN